MENKLIKTFKEILIGIMKYILLGYYVFSKQQ